MIDAAFLQESMERQGIAYSEPLFEQLDLYARFLVEWNEKMNLTAITDPEGIVVKHFVDSLLLIRALDIPENARMVDVGSGAGFPSLPVALYRRDLDVTLLDSLNKRVVFLEELAKALGIPAKAVHSRAEEAGQSPAFREKFDLATARAVAHLRELSEYCLPLVKVGGCFAALKGGDVEGELEEACYAISQMGGRMERAEKFSLGEEGRRTILIFRKVRPTPAKYPRPAAKMKKSPLIPR